MAEQRLFGLIGYPLSHSFSKKYFTEKFAREGITDAYYELFPIERIEELPELIAAHPNLVGLNVTIPYKQAVIPYMNRLGAGAKAVGAVNTIKVTSDGLQGFNSDVYGFEQSLLRAFEDLEERPKAALILGTGGAAKAVEYVMDKLGIASHYVSRSAGAGQLTYSDLDQSTIEEHHLIINTTPLGMSPNVDTFPPIPYQYAGTKHLFFDLVYNPEETAFLKLGAAQGSKTQNGLDMLYGQAERSWQFWQQL
ncbi:shikimate dehydrogenase family protein [Flavilitoribacter nigricans]|uniref:Shikimate dehydrogenase n=1 Tax=Flavilitoribacter nigricans (strain ATCC 23147 / DSM 23189 / NBRC 102662 / NCIMB 1420 / SS-2) TaxID=1122177 RepID=A0A2D0NCZ1_FLAN2|nr:shikimate dehydrogenase [Flavilitoribacter nigricans]PHN06347.1 shikimate dehydrogenase [Flavilitoribacter nigricans DSM 23189 = NBRC 102662]